jgi:class 3 adenylate cyclase
MFTGVPVPPNDAERVAVLKQYRVLDTPPEFEYDALAELAAQICGCPVALIGLIDETRDWLKAKYGLPAAMTEAPRDVVVCAATICQNDLMYVPDLSKDERFKDYPTVAGDPHIRFYCGMPMINRDGFALGSFCVVDFEPHEITPAQREAVRRLAQQALTQLELRRQLLERDELLRDLEKTRSAMEAEQAQSEALLRTIFPAAVATELKANRPVQPRHYDLATIMFVDFTGFTRLTEGTQPAALVQQLNQHFTRFDEIVERNRLETVKTIGDAYLCAGGLPEPNRTHPIDACLAALEIQAYLAATNRQREKLRMQPWKVRIGINSGPVVAGLVGKRRFTYDIWGDSVNVAQRLEAAAEPGRINIAASTSHYVNKLFELEPRGSIEVKNKPPLEMFFVNRIKPEYAADADGTTPNAAFWQAA